MKEVSSVFLGKVPEPWGLKRYISISSPPLRKIFTAFWNQPEGTTTWHGTHLSCKPHNFQICCPSSRNGSSGVQFSGGRKTDYISLIIWLRGCLYLRMKWLKTRHNRAYTPWCFSILDVRSKEPLCTRNINSKFNSSRTGHWAGSLASLTVLGPDFEGWRSQDLAEKGGPCKKTWIVHTRR